jgi:16S rRNA G966 N2-methylase RsmD
MSHVNVRMPTIPAIKLPEIHIPGLQGVKKMFADLFNILARFVDVLKRIAGIGSLGQEAATVLAAAADLIEAIKKSTAWMLTAAATLLYLGVAWFLLSYAMWVHRRQRVGWALVRGAG